MKSIHLTIIVALICTACGTKPVQNRGAGDKFFSGDCSTVPASVEHALPRGDSPWRRTLSLPATGQFVEESHYVTTEDEFGDKAWPSEKSVHIKAHLQRSFRAYKAYDPKADINDLYGKTWQKEWTPEEGGHFGQGSVGVSQLSELSVDMEMWFLTMMWAKGGRPAKGTRFLLSANGKSVVVQAGYETGPASEKFIGGVTREVHKWLNTSSDNQITISKLKNQETALGPVRCR